MLSGLLEDVNRIVTRKLITEPLAESLLGVVVAGQCAFEAGATPPRDVMHEKSGVNTLVVEVPALQRSQLLAEGDERSLRRFVKLFPAISSDRPQVTDPANKNAAREAQERADKGRVSLEDGSQVHLKLLAAYLLSFTAGLLVALAVSAGALDLVRFCAEKLGLLRP